jgi:hypothetical protein
MEDDCPVCFQALEWWPTATTACNHKFHKECMLDWTKRQDFCPIDRIPIDVEIVFD